MTFGINIYDSQRIIKIFVDIFCPLTLTLYFVLLYTFLFLYLVFSVSSIPSLAFLFPVKDFVTPVLQSVI